MKVASIDMGTNTFLCLIADVAANGEIQVIEDHAQVVRLGEKVHENRFFLPAALERARTCLEKFKKVIDRNHADKIIATATSAARDAKNGGELRRICENLNIPLHIIGGKKEAELSYAGAVSALPEREKKNILVVDIGGGSTEFIYKQPGRELRAESFNVGSVRLTELFLKTDPPSQLDMNALEDHARQVIAGYGAVQPDLVVAVAGTPTTLACIDLETQFDENKVEGYILTLDKIESLIRRLAGLSLEKRKQVVGLDPLRADVIVAGAILLKLSLELSRRDDLRVSTRGLRFGVALHHGKFR